MRPRAAISWSGGKDCCTALLRTHPEFDITAILTMFAEDGERSRSHGLRPDIIAGHAQRLGVTSLTGRCSWASYTDEYIRMLGEASALGVTHVIFGDIMGEAHRAWDERVCAAHGLTPVLPLWGASTRTLVEEFIASGSTAVIVTARAAHLDESWLGRTITSDAVRELEALGVDPCGEYGEYHTLVTNTPPFHAPLEVTFGAREMHSDCWALDVVPGPVEAGPYVSHAAR
ncbi:MAG: diphthine--ammonia ligase [Candidatus Dormibacteria bacterium]